MLRWELLVRWLLPHFLLVFDAKRRPKLTSECKVLINHQRDHPFEPPPFRFGVFIAGTLPFGDNVKFGRDVSKYFHNVDMYKYIEEHPVPEVLRQKSGFSTNVSGPRVAQDDKGQPSQTFRMFWPPPERMPVQLPSVHVHGTKDGWFEQSLEMAELFESRNRSTLQHDGGHQIPSSSDIIQKMCKMIEVAARKSELQQ